MQMKRAGLVVLLLIAVVAGAVRQSSSTMAQDDMGVSCEAGTSTAVGLANEAKAVLVLSSLETGNLSHAQNFLGETYIQHNLSVPDGRDAFISLAEMLSQSGAKANILRVITMGDLVAVHSEFDIPMFGGKSAAFDVYRFENGQIVEHWDNIQPIAEPNASGHTLTDGATEVTDLDQTQANCEKVVEFITRAFIEGDTTVDFTQYINPDMYIQHNPLGSDGFEGLGAFLQWLADNNQTMTFNQIHMVVAQGNFVLTLSEGVFGPSDNPTPTAFYDLFRLENGLIVEHWDVLSPIPPQEEWQNQNGKF